MGGDEEILIEMTCAPAEGAVAEGAMAESAVAEGAVAEGAMAEDAVAEDSGHSILGCAINRKRCTASHSLPILLCPLTLRCMHLSQLALQWS